MLSKDSEEDRLFFFFLNMKVCVCGGGRGRESEWRQGGRRDIKVGKRCKNKTMESVVLKLKYNYSKDSRNHEDVGIGDLGDNGRGVVKKI